MKYTAIVLLFAVALVDARVRDYNSNGCPTDWSIEQLLPHPNCHKFYQCWDGELVEHACPSNLYFNIEANRCEWAEKVDCGDRDTSVVTPDESDENDSVIDENKSDENEVEENESDENENNDNGNTGAGNCDPSQAPAICAEDDSDGVLVAHENCNQFYICAHGKPVVANCPANLLFNPNKDVCDYPENVECEDRIIPEGDNDSNGDNESEDNGNTGTCNCDPGQAPSICAEDDSEGVLVAHENCNQFYICDHGAPVALSCPNGLLFNPYTDQCDHAENVECGDRVIPEGDDGNDNENDSTGDNGSDDNDSNGDNESEDNGNTGTCNCDPGQAPSICAEDDSEGVLVAHENCNQFYICDHGAPVALSCPNGLLFNPYTDQCDHAENVECGDRVIPEGDDGNDSDNGSTGDNGSEDNDSNGDNESEDNGNTGTCNCDPGQAPSICAEDDSEGVLVAHENCNQFYICDHGAPVALSCPNGLLFNPYTDQCDHAENVECGDRVIPEGDDGNDSDNGSTGDNGSEDNDSNGDNEGEDNGNTGTCNCDPGQAPSICAEDDSEGVLVAHENCNQFYICDHGAPVTLSCPNGLLFNPYTDQCDHAENVECGDRVIPDGDDGNDSDNDSIGDNGSEDNDSNGDNGSEDNDSNGDNGSEDNGSTGAGNGDPSQAPTICAADESDGVLVAHENCNQFYICDHGAPVALSCPNGLLFNPYTDQCDHAENVECGDRVIPEGDDGNDSENDSTDDNGSEDNDSNGDNGSEDNGSTGAGNGDPSQAPTICAADESDGVLVAHENCNQFYICDHGAPVALSCPNGLLFNPYTDQCDHAENVECGDRVIPDGDDGNDSDNDSTGDNGSEDNDSNGDNESEDNGSTGAGNGDPSQAPTICAADESDGVLVAHENCNQFYICDHGAPVALSCPNGLLFNPYTDQCDHAENVECGDRVIPEGDDGNDSENDSTDDNGSEDNDSNGDNDSEDNGNTGTCNCDPGQAPSICAEDDSEGVLVAHENCNQFYICDHGAPVALSCPNGLLFNPYTDQCDHAENVECGDRVIPDGDDGNDSDNDSTGDNESDNNDSNGDNGSDDNGSTGAGNCDPSQAPTICAADESDGVLVAHENCNQFYKCAHGVPVALSCPENLFFNPNIDACDYLENVDCGDRVIPDGADSDDNDSSDDSENEDNNNGGSEDNGNNGNTGAGNCDPSQAPAICAADESDGVLVAHENCNQFYKCAHGVPVALSCPANLFFNPHLDACDYIENVDCGDRVIPDGADSDDNDSSDDNENEDNNNGESEDNENNTGAGNCDPSQAPTICAVDGSDGVLVAHENCNQFYKCANGGPVALSCPANLFFNPNIDACDYLENVDCGDRVIPDGDNGNADDGSNDDNENEDNNNGGSEDNESNGNIGAGNCDPSQAPAICAADGSDGVLVAHENCNQFYKCAFGGPVALSCPANLYFNPSIDACDYLENVDCGDKVIPDGEDRNDSNDNGSSDGNDNEDNNNAGSEDNENNGNTGSGNCDPSQAPAICATDGSDGVLVAHENCNQFYKCSYGGPVALSCPANLYFNPSIDACDYLENVDCADRVIPDGDDESDSNDNGSSDGNDNEDNNNAGSEDNENNGNTGSGNCDPSQAPAICATDGSDGVLVAHENCNQFYKCSYGGPVALSCPANLYFNPSIDACDYLENVDCADRVIPDGDNDEEDSNNNEDNNDNGDDNDTNTGTCNCDPGQAPSLCSAEESDGILVANEKCNKFYICVHGRPITLSCPANLYYNPYAKQCDYLENVYCGDRIIPDGDDVNDNEENETDAGENDATDGDDSNSDQDDTGALEIEDADVVCANIHSHSVYLPHPNCNQFFTCLNGKAIEITCPTGLLYDTTEHICMWPESVRCGNRVIPNSFLVQSLNKHLESRQALRQF